MRSLNDSLRQEFTEILNEKDVKEMIVARHLDADIIKKAFQKLLENKYGTDDISIIEKGRAEFETIIINTIKTKNH